MSSTTQNGMIGLTYSRALLELALEAGQVDEVANELDQIALLLAATPELEQLLGSRVISAQQRDDSIWRIFESRISQLLLRFLLVVNRKNRIGELATIIVQFRKLLDEHRGIIEANAYVAVRLAEAQLGRIARSIGDKIGRTVVLHQYVEPELIGGLRIRIGDQLIDGSVASQLRRMRRHLTEAGADKAKALDRE